MRRAIAAAAACFAAAAFAQPAMPEKARVCAPCHGPQGISVQPDAPNLAGQPRPYLAAQLVAYRSGKRSHEQMSVVAKALSDADVRELADWYGSITVEVKAAPK